MADTLRRLIVDYLREQKLMQLATLGGDGAPWICSVWFGFDDDLTIYFFSATNRQHSVEIERDSRVAVAMALPHTPQDPPRGLQFKGAATRLTEEADVAKARSVYQGRIFDGATVDTLMVHPERPHAFYKVVPSLFVLFDAVNFPDNSRQEYPVRAKTTDE